MPMTTLSQCVVGTLTMTPFCTKRHCLNHRGWISSTVREENYDQCTNNLLFVSVCKICSALQWQGAGHGRLGWNTTTIPGLSSPLRDSATEAETPEHLRLTEQNPTNGLFASCATGCTHNGSIFPSVFQFCGGERANVAILRSYFTRFSSGYNQHMPYWFCGLCIWELKNQMSRKKQR